MSIAYAVGLIVGLGVGATGFLGLRKLLFKNREKAKYDERQKIEQGKAATSSMYFLMIYCFAYGLVDGLLEITEISTFIAMVCGVILTVLLYACICIWNEAYFPVNQSTTRWMVFLFAVGLFNFFVAYINRDDINPALTNTMCGILCMAVTGVSYIKLTVLKNKDAEDSDEELE